MCDICNEVASVSLLFNHERTDDTTKTPLAYKVAKFWLNTLAWLKMSVGCKDAKA